MTIDGQIKDEKIKDYREAVSSGKVDKYEYITGEKIYPSNQ